MSLDIANDYDYREAFRVANESGIAPVPGMHSSGAAKSFGVDDVAETLAFSRGENDESDWLWVGILRDGRFAFVQAGCDFTGWD